MQKDLLKLALTGLAAGVCLSAQGGGSEIAMTKCSKTPPANQEQNGNNGQMKENDDQDSDDQDSDDTDDDDMDDSSSCNSQSGSCASNYGDQGDQSSQRESLRRWNSMETKRLSAAKAAMGGESRANMDK